MNMTDVDIWECVCVGHQKHTFLEHITCLPNVTVYTKYVEFHTGHSLSTPDPESRSDE